MTPYILGNSTLELGFCNGIQDCAIFSGAQLRAYFHWLVGRMANNYKAVRSWIDTPSMEPSCGFNWAQLPQLPKNQHRTPLFPKITMEITIFGIINYFWALKITQ